MVWTYLLGRERAHLADGFALVPGRGGAFSGHESPFAFWLVSKKAYISATTSFRAWHERR